MIKLNKFIGSNPNVLKEYRDKKIILKALKSLSERDRQIIQMRFGISADGKTRKEKTQKEVADILGISQSYISRLEKRIIDKLKEYLTKQNY